MRLSISSIWFICYFLFLMYVVEIKSYGCIKQLTSCSCETTVIGWTLDLSSLDSKHTGIALQTISPISHTTYVFNPCSSFQCSMSSDSSLCAKNNRAGYPIAVRSIGERSSARFSRHESPKTIVLEYPRGQLQDARSQSLDRRPEVMTLVELVCDRSLNGSAFTLISEPNLQSTQEYRFRLYTPLACAESRADWLLIGAILLATWVFVWFVVILGVIGKMVCLKVDQKKHGVELALRVRLANIGKVGPDACDNDDARAQAIALDSNSPSKYEAATRGDDHKRNPLFSI